jgi:hypothetical protein
MKSFKLLTNFLPVFLFITACSDGPKQEGSSVQAVLGNSELAANNTLPKAEKCESWATTWLPARNIYMLNNTYGNNPNVSLCHWMTSETSWGSAWDHKGTTGGVAAQAQVGQWPWSNDNTVNSGLPKPVRDGKKTKSSWEFTHNIQSGLDWNMFWEVWLHKDKTISGNNITLDLMIHPAYGKKDGNIIDTVTFDGVKWDIWMQTHPTGFPLVHFYRQEQTGKVGTININSFLEYCISKGWGSGSDWIGSVTAGQESFSGKGSFATSAWKVWHGDTNSQEPTPAPVSNVVLVDNASDFSKIHSRSNGWRIEKWTSFGGDTNHFQRDNSIQEWLRYVKPKIKNAKITLRYAGNYDGIVLESQVVGESSWKQLQANAVSTRDVGNGWQEVVLEVKEFVKNSNSLKISFNSSASKWWTPVIGQVEIISESP